MSLPLETISPALITYEYVLLSQENFDKALDYVHKFGYTTCVWGQNIVAFQLDMMGQAAEKDSSLFLAEAQAENFREGPLQKFDIKPWPAYRVKRYFGQSENILMTT